MPSTVRTGEQADVAEVDFEKSWNDATELLRKSMSDDTLRKAKGAPPPPKGKGEDDEESEPTTDEEEEESESEDDDEEDDDGMEKSLDIESRVAEDDEAAGAMDVEPFLREFAKAHGYALMEMHAVLRKAVKKVARLESLVKSQSGVLLNTATLQKATGDLVSRLARQPLPIQGSLTKGKPTVANRFSGGEAPDGREVLLKSRQWLEEGKISTVEAGMIEGRVNKNLLGRMNDPLDQKIAVLLGGEK